jgi:gluconate:H+ symporter, GntP family
LEDLKKISAKEDQSLPGLGVSLLPVMIPLVLICLDTAFSNFLKGSNSDREVCLNQFAAVIKFFGDKNIAIILGGVAALGVMAKNKKDKGQNLSHLCRRL